MGVTTAICVAAMLGTLAIRKNERWKIAQEQLEVEQRTREIELEKLNLEIGKRRDELEQNRAAVESQKAEALRQQSEEKTRLLLLRHKKELQLTEVKEARLALERVVTAQAFLHGGIESLKTNHVHRAITTSAIMIFHARRLFADAAELTIPAKSFERHRDILQRIQDEINTRLDLPVELDEQIVKNIAQEMIWIHTQNEIISAMQDRLNELLSFKLRYGIPSFNTPQYPPSLEAAISNQMALEATNVWIVYPENKDEWNRMMPLYEQRMREVGKTYDFSR